MIIQGGNLVAARCILPVSESKKLSPHLGLRHRAEVGLTEQSDAFVVVVSEETGLISVAYNGRMVRRLDISRLRNVLRAFFQHRLGGRGWTKQVGGGED